LCDAVARRGPHRHNDRQCDRNVVRESKQRATRSGGIDRDDVDRHDDCLSAGLGYGLSTHEDAGDLMSMGTDRRFGGLTICPIASQVFPYGPVRLLPLFSFNDSIYITFPLKGFTFDWYRQMVDNAQLIECLRASLGVASSVAVVSTILGTLAAKAITRYRLPG